MMHCWCADVIVLDILESSSFQKYRICHVFCATWYDMIWYDMTWNDDDDKQGKIGLLSQWTSCYLNLWYYIWWCCMLFCLIDIYRYLSIFIDIYWYLLISISRCGMLRLLLNSHTSLVQGSPKFHNKLSSPTLPNWGHLKLSICNLKQNKQKQLRS